MTDYGNILDQLAFCSMSTKRLIERIAVDMMRGRDAAHWNYDYITQERVELHVKHLVKTYGSLGGNMTRKRLINAVMKRIRSIERKGRETYWAKRYGQDA